MTASNMAFTFMKLEKENSKFEIIGILIFNPFALFSEVAVEKKQPSLELPERSLTVLIRLSHPTSHD